MIEFCAIGIAGLVGYYRHKNKEVIADKQYTKKLKRTMNNKWTLCMKYSNIKNNNDESFQILEIIPKEYGCDCIISIPLGLNAKKIFDNLTTIEQNFSAKVYINISPKGNSIYARFVLYPDKLNELDSIRCKWNKIMLSDNKLYNQDLETFAITQIKEQKKYGYDLSISIPIGKTAANIESTKDIIETNFKGKVYLNNTNDNQLLLKLITKEFNDDYKFTPVKTDVTQLFIGMTYDYQNVIIDLKQLSHMLYTGITNSGKTVCLFTALTNLIYYHNEKEWELYLTMISNKKDMKIFKDVKQCRYYADTLDKAVNVFTYLYKENERRNKLFDSDKENSIFNIDQWNKKHPHKKLRRIIVATDEISFYMPDSLDNEDDTKIKNICLDTMLKLYKEGRSTGIHLLTSLQRPDISSLPPRIKSNIGARISFYQPNIASSLVVVDSDEATKIRPQREAIVMADKKYLMKTLYLDEDMIKNFISPSVEVNHQYIYLTENHRKSNKNIEKLQENNVKVKEIDKKTQNKSVSNRKNNNNFTYSMPGWKQNNTTKSNKSK